MTISHSASTGVSDTTGARGTTSTTVAYVGVAADRMAVIVASAKSNTAVLSISGTGWTKVVDAAGGTGTVAADTGQTRVAMWWRVLDGAESGSVTVNATSGDAVCAVMSTYAKTAAAWMSPVAVFGSDAGHGTNFSAACGTWASTLAAGDMVVVGIATDTDNTAVPTTHAITQTGTTYGTVNYRNRLLNSSGNDNSVVSFDAAVSSGGSTNAPTVTFTHSASSCGPAAVVRLREGSLSPSLATISDNFDDNTINTSLWANNYGTTSETGGRSRVECSTTYAGFQTATAYSFGTWHIQPFPAATSGATTECYTAAYVISAGQSAGRDVGWMVNRISGDIRFEMREDYFDAGATTATYNSSTHAWVRMRLSGGNLLWDTSTDGSNWTNRRSATPPNWLTAAQDCSLLWESHRAEGTTNFAEFDNFNITLDTSAPAGSTTGTGEAPDVAAITTTTADAASAAGAGQDASGMLGGQADAAAAAGTAYDAAVVIQLSAVEAATGAGASLDPVPDVAPAAGVTSGTGSSFDAGPVVASVADAAVATGTVPDAAAAIQLAAVDVTTSTGTGLAAVPDVAAAPDAAAAAGTANDVTTPVQPFAVNIAEGVADETTVTTGNSGGASGNAFNSVTIGTDATLVGDTAQAAHGTVSYRHATGATSATSMMAWTEARLGVIARAYGRLYVRFSAFGVSRGVMRARSSATNQVARIQVTSAGRIELRNGANTSVATAAGTLSTNTWYRLEFDFQPGTSVTNSIHIYAGDSTTLIETVSASSNYSSDTDVSQVWFGNAAAASSLPDMWYDDLQVNDTALPGPAAVTATVEVATCAGAAHDAVGSIGALADAGSGGGTAGDPQTTAAVTAAVAAAASAGHDAAVALTAGPASALATSAGNDGTTDTTVGAGAATGTAVAFDATASTSSNTNAAADLTVAAGTGADAVVSLTASPDPAAASSVAAPADVALGGGAAAATASGSALPPAAALYPEPSDAAASGAAPDATPALTAPASTADAAGAAFGAIVSAMQATEVYPGAASAAGTTLDALAELAAYAELVTVLAEASDAQVVISGRPGALTTTTTAATAHSGTPYRAPVLATTTRTATATSGEWP